MLVKLPPTKSIMVLLMYCIDTSLVLRIPISGHNATGIKAVTGNGSTSNIQYNAIMRIMKPQLALSERSIRGIHIRPRGTNTARIGFQLAKANCSQGPLDLAPIPDTIDSKSPP